MTGIALWDDDRASSRYRWYVAGVLAGLEATAIHHLSRAGITAYSPSVKVEDRPVRLFPGYVFVELESPNEAGVVNRQRGVHRMLPIHANAPLALPVGFVEELWNKIARRDFDEREVVETIYRFVPQEEVFIKTGPFADHRGKFLRFNKGCGVVLAYLLGKEHELRIPARELAPIRQRHVGWESRSAGGVTAAA